MSRGRATIIMGFAAALLLGLPSTNADASPAEQARVESSADLSAQTRRDGRRRPPRITVRPAERDLSNYKRACVPVFEERWIPQWGGYVLYASQRCRWVRE